MRVHSVDDTPRCGMSATSTMCQSHRSQLITHWHLAAGCMLMLIDWSKHTHTHTCTDEPWLSDSCIIISILSRMKITEKQIRIVLHVRMKATRSCGNWEMSPRPAAVADVNPLSMPMTHTQIHTGDCLFNLQFGGLTRVDGVGWVSWIRITTHTEYNLFVLIGAVFVLFASHDCKYHARMSRLLFLAGGVASRIL